MQTEPIHQPPRYRLVFEGECLTSHNPQAVRTAVVRALLLDEANAARLFSGKRVVIRQDLDAASARRHIKRFARMGAVLRAEPGKPGQSPPSRAVRPVAPFFAAPTITTGPTPRGGRWPVMAAALSAMCLVGALMFWQLLDPPNEPVVAAEPVPTLPAAASSPWAQVLQGPAFATASTGAELTAASPTQGTAAKLPLGMNAQALAEHQLRYVSAKAFKAFALSNDGAFAWHAGAASDKEARDLALNRCMAAMAPGDYGCRVVDSGGRWEE